MKKILLAIDGLSPDKRIVEYAVGLCRRIRAELDILHIVDPEIYGTYAKQLQKKASRAKGYFEQTMVAAAFAEGGAHDAAKTLMDSASANFHQLVSDADWKWIHYQAKIPSDRIDREITRYVNQNRNIVLAIYEGATHPDTPDNPAETGKPGKKRNNAGSRKDPVAGQLRKKLSVPLVVRNEISP
ncbi:MAG: universal stress protein [Desulfobacterales bacterium]|nr:universal stress protein [Desulfobacterales bacterium]